MAEYIGSPSGVQAVALRQPVATAATIPCSRGNVFHEDGTGIYILRGGRNGCSARYTVKGKSNIALPEGATVTPIAVAITVNGEVRQSSRAISTPAAALEYNEATSPAIITVPCGCCFTVAFEPVPASDDPTVTPAPVINMLDTVVEIVRTA